MSGAAKIVHGQFRGTGALVNVTKVGFRPKRVKLFNDTAEEAWWQEGMTDGTMFKRVAAGTLTLVASPNGIIPLATGFSLGADTDLNASGEVLRYECTD